MPVSCNRGDLAMLAVDYQCSEFFSLPPPPRQPLPGACPFWRREGPASLEIATWVQLTRARLLRAPKPAAGEEMRRALLLLLVTLACEAGAPSSILGRRLLEDDVEIPPEIKAKDSPMGVINAARFLSDPDVANKTANSPEAMKAWRKAAKAAGKAALNDLEDEIVADDAMRGSHRLADGGFTRGALLKKELDDVADKARGLAVPAGDPTKGGEESTEAFANAEAQATASAYMAAGESAAAEPYIHSMGALGKIPKERNLTPWARSPNTRSGKHAARGAAGQGKLGMTVTVHAARGAAGSGTGAAPLLSGGGREEQAAGRSKLGSGIESLLLLFTWGGSRVEQPDELEGVDGGGSEQLAAMASNGKSGTGYTGVDDGPVWHQAASAVWHPAAGAPSAAGAAAPAPSPSAFNPSLYPPGYKHAFDDDYPRGAPGTQADPNPSEAAAAGGGAAAAASVWVSATPPMGSGGLANKEQLLPPGSGMRGPPPERPGDDDAKSGASNKLDRDIDAALARLDKSLHKEKSSGDALSASKKLDQDISDALGRLSSSSKGLTQAIGQSEEHSKSCSVLQVGVCRDQCKSKVNLDMGAKSMQECMPECLGDCAEEFGFKTTNLEKAAVGMIQKADARLIQKVEDEVVTAATGKKASAALSREDKRQADSIAKGALARLANKVQHSQLSPQAAGAISSSGGSRLLPADVVQPAGTATGIYDCRGADILVGSVVGRMVGGQPCEDRMLLVTAGKWQVSGVGPMGSGGGGGFTDDRTARADAGAEKVDVVLKGISPDVNMGTRLNFEPVKGAMTDWKVIEGETNDLFLPENVKKLRAFGGANQAMSPGSVGKSAAVLAHARADHSGARSDKLEQAMIKDWDTTSSAEHSSRSWQYYPHGGSGLKYVVGAVVLAGIGAWQLASRGGVTLGGVMGGISAAGDAAARQQQYVSLPDIFGGKRGEGGEGGMEMEDKGVEGGRVIMVNVGGGGKAPPGAGGGGDGVQAGGYQDL